MDITLNTNMSVSANASAGTEKTSAVRETESAGELVKADQTETRSKYDTVELSDEAIQYLAETESTEENVSAEAAAAVTEAESDEITSSELYSYTESQLKELLVNGDITRAEYNAEIAKRNADVSEEE